MPRHAGLDRARHRLAAGARARGRARRARRRPRALARGTRRAAPAPAWACGQRVVPALSWTSAGFTKPLRLVLEAVLRPRREIEVVEAAAASCRGSPTPARSRSLADALLYEPAIRAGLRGARRRAPAADRQRPHLRALPARARPRPARAGRARGRSDERRSRPASLQLGRRRAGAAAAGHDPERSRRACRGAAARRRCSPTASCGGCGARAPSTRERHRAGLPRSPRRWSAALPARRAAPSCRSAGARATGGSATTRSCSSALLALARFAIAAGGVGHRQRLRADGRRPRPHVRGLRRGAARARAARSPRCRRTSTDLLAMSGAAGGARHLGRAGALVRRRWPSRSSCSSRPAASRSTTPTRTSS